MAPFQRDLGKERQGEMNQRCGHDSGRNACADWTDLLIGQEMKNITADLVRILHRTASSYHELMQSFWEKDVASLHILTCDKKFLSLAELCGHHCVFELHWRLSL